MTETEFADMRRAAQALRTGLRQQAELPAFRPFDVAELVASPPVSAPRYGRWLGASVAVAAMAVAAALLVPGSLGSGTVPAVPGRTPTFAPTPADPPTGWQRMATPPLSPRHDSVTAWSAGSYLLIGGVAEALCDAVAPNEDRSTANCDEQRPLVDGAAYDPSTDTWKTIADAPAGLRVIGGASNPDQAVVVRDRLYLPTDDAMLAYDVGDDAWQVLPGPSGLAKLLGWGEKLVAVPYQGGAIPTSYEVFDPAAGVWSRHSIDLRPPVAQASSVIVAGGRLVIDAIVGDDGGTWLATVDLATGAARVVPDVPADLGMTMVGVADVAVWPGADDAAVAWALDPSAETWDSTLLPTTPGGLTGWNGGTRNDWHVVAAALVGLRGHLYGPTAGQWAVVSALPVPNHDPVVAGGADGVLACFGYRSSGSYADACYLLRPEPGSLPSPTPEPNLITPTAEPPAPAPTEEPSAIEPTLVAPSPTPILSTTPEER